MCKLIKLIWKVDWSFLRENPVRLLALIFAVCAFAAIKSYEGSVDVTLCGDKIVHLVFDEPFALSDVKYQIEKLCENIELVGFDGDFTVEGKLFVLLCWVSFLYCLAFLFVRLMLQKDWFCSWCLCSWFWSIFDFLVVLTVSVAWIVNFVLWTLAVLKIKKATDPYKEMKDCAADLNCQIAFRGSFSDLYLSVAMGLVSSLLWLLNLVFLKYDYLTGMYWNRMQNFVKSHCFC